MIERITATLASAKPVSKRFITNSAYKKYILVKKESECALNQEAINSEKKKDGFFGIITNVKVNAMSAAEIVSNYKELWRIEDAFYGKEIIMQSGIVRHACNQVVNPFTLQYHFA